MMVPGVRVIPDAGAFCLGEELMWVKKRFIRSLFFLAAWWLAFSWPLFPLPSNPGQTEDFGNELSRLLEISEKLSEVNETLRNELAGSRQNSNELQTHPHYRVYLTVVLDLNDRKVIGWALSADIIIG
jgi:hypothetical protein